MLLLSRLTQQTVSKSRWQHHGPFFHHVHTRVDTGLSVKYGVGNYMYILNVCLAFFPFIISSPGFQYTTRIDIYVRGSTFNLDVLKVFFAPELYFTHSYATIQYRVLIKSLLDFLSLI